MKHIDGNIVYISSQSVHNEMKKLNAIKNRAEIVDELVRSYGLLEYYQVIAPEKCTLEDLLSFHSSDYIACLKRYNEEDEIDDVTDELQEFGLAYDCPLLENIYDYVTTVAGSTLAAVDAILHGAKAAINWNGGWHHAQRDNAAGFCYVNDIVIGVQRLRTVFQKVLYLDLDVHHGDGVESAFCSSKYVMTVSFHQYEPGYFPGTGNISDIGLGNGKGYTVNAPYSRDVSGMLFVPYFAQVASAAFEAFQPHVCIVQCGGDVIAGDHLGGTNLTPEDCVNCVKQILGWNIPTIFLGGGGYNIVNTAKYWTELTATIANASIPRDIPENEFFLDFGPDYVLDVYRRNAEDKNTKHDLLEKLFIIRGDGVESAFCSSKYVMTVSFHQYEPGYFPGTGNISDIGLGNGKGYTVNAPYSRDVSGMLFVPYFAQVASAAFEAFQPHVCIVQCGGDVIAGDHLGGTNLTPEDCVNCVKQILGWNIPTIFLGGGGYNIVNTAKYWTELTATIANASIPRDIPENEFFLDFGPDYVLDVYRRNAEDKNTKHDLLEKLFIIRDNLKRFVASPTLCQ